MIILYYETVKKLCQENGISVRELEQRAKIANGTIGKWQEKNQPTVKTLVKIADYFGISVSDLMRREDA